MKNKSLLLSFLIPILFATGCAQTTTWYLGAQAASEGAVVLSQGEKKNQNWNDLYISVDYSYKRDGDHLGIKGVFSFSDGSQINYLRVRDLKLKLFFLDENLRVVEYFDIVRTLSNDLGQQLRFLRTFKLPTNVTAFTFGYEGLLADEGRFGSRIWNMPKRNH